MSPPADGARRAMVALVLAVVATLALARGDAARDPPPPTAGAEPPPASAPGPTGASCDGVTIAPSADPHLVMQQHPAGTTYCLAAGVHRLRQPLVPERGDVLAGRSGAVLSGALVLEGWSRVADGWSAEAFLPRTPVAQGTCLPRVPACGLAHDVYVDGRLLERVESRDQVGPGTFHADHAANRITVGTDPQGRLVEQAVAPSLVRSVEDDVTVRDLVLEKAANEAQVAAVESRDAFPIAGARWEVVHTEVRLNHGVGIGIGSAGTVRANVVRDQGQLGISVWGDAVEIRDNEIAGNGTAGYHPDWESGGVKSWMTTGLVLAGNHVHHNRGPGLWSDGGCDRTTYTGNLVTDNWGAGIQHEISYDARIVSNRILRNGLRHKGWAWEAGIQVQSSGGRGLIEVAHNVVADNANGITVIESGERRHEPPAPQGPHVVRNVLVHHNTVSMGPGQSTGLFQDVGDHGVFSRGIRFIANTYRVDSTAEAHFAWADDHLTWSTWLGPAVGQDPRGLLVLAEPGGS
jgi:hypothetical protein